MIKLSLRFFGIFAILMTLAFSGARAQSSDALSSEAAKPIPNPHIIVDEDKKQSELDEAIDTLAKLDPETQEEITKESKSVQYYCTNNMLLSNFYDCECYGLKFIKERIDRGPEPGMSQIIAAGDFDVCINPPQIAAYGYGRCNMTLNVGGVRPQYLEDVCSCVGNGIARLYARYPYSRIFYIDKLFMDSIKDCRRKHGRE